MTIGYKLLRISRGNLVSCNTYGKFKVSYSSEDKIYPLIGKLFVYDTLKNASRFFPKHGCSFLQIWEVEFDTWEAPADKFQVCLFEEFYEYYWNEGGMYYYNNGMKIGNYCPKGTLLVPWLTMIKQANLELTTLTF